MCFEGLFNASSLTVRECQRPLGGLVGLLLAKCLGSSYPHHVGLGIMSNLLREGSSHAGRHPKLTIREQLFG